MHIPLFSTITLVTEFFVTIGVLAVIIRGYRTGIFMRALAYGVLAYETLFNITYMATRATSAPGATQVYNPYTTTLAIFHGTFSLLMFVLLVVFFMAAAQRYALGENFFRIYRRTTYAFVIAWLTSVVSGFAFFIALYL